MKKGLIFAIAFVVVSAMSMGVAFAWDQDYHVVQAPNGIGDLLVFPGFYADANGWETKITITNTHEDYSVVAKVVFRSHYYTEELLDFLIYLSPRDVWVGYVRDDGNNTYLYSEDDSILVAFDEFASPSNPVSKAFYGIDCPGTAAEPEDSTDRGYIEVIETWWGDTSNYPAGTTFTASQRQPPKVDKRYILGLYNPTSGSAQPAGLQPGGNSAGGWDQTVNVMTGHMEIQNRNMSGMTAALRATVFSDFDITADLTVGTVSGLNSWQGLNTRGELEAAMAKDNIAMPYVNRTGENTLHMFNFPTKQSRDGGNFDSIPPCYFGTNFVGANDAGTSAEVAFWNQRGSVADTRSDDYGCLGYSLGLWDLKEAHTEGTWSGGTGIERFMCEEFEMIAANSGVFSGIYDEGWIEYRFNYDNYQSTQDPTPFEVQSALGGGDTLQYRGAPVIPWVLFAKNGGISAMYPAWDDGLVEEIATGQDLYNYQYYNMFPDAVYDPNSSLGVVDFRDGVHLIPNYP